MIAPQIDHRDMVREFALLQAKRQQEILALDPWKRPGVSFPDVFAPRKIRRPSAWYRYSFHELDQMPRASRLLSESFRHPDHDLT